MIAFRTIYVPRNAVLSVLLRPSSISMDSAEMMIMLYQQVVCFNVIMMISAHLHLFVRRIVIACPGMQALPNHIPGLDRRTNRRTWMCVDNYADLCMRAWSVGLASRCAGCADRVAVAHSVAVAF